MAKRNTKDSQVQQTLFELKEPVLLKNVLHPSQESNSWKILDWSLEDLAIKLGTRKFPFRVGKNAATEDPQWEVETPIEEKTMTEFLEEAKQNNHPQWYYFDYKRMNQWFQELPEILDCISWNQFGPELTGSDSTIWIGSKGAHTNCHQDTYGCNLVAQTHGRKFWLLFSPDCCDSLEPTRIPYEESTIYSRLNFFAPDGKEIQSITSMSGLIKMVVLEPKDVLFIPKGWWHYVESLDTSMSINVWLPVNEDCSARLRETLVHCIMDTIGKNITRTENHMESILPECIQFVQNSLKECQEFFQRDEIPLKKKRLNMDQDRLLQTLQEKYLQHVQPILDLKADNIALFLNKNEVQNCAGSQRPIIHKNREQSSETVLSAVIDAFCHPSVISRVSEILMDQFVKEKSEERS